MFRHPAWAVGSYSSGPSAARDVGTKSTGGFANSSVSPCTYLMAYVLCRPNLENAPLSVERVECEVHLAVDLGVRFGCQLEHAIVDVVPQIPVSLRGGLVLLG